MNARTNLHQAARQCLLTCDPAEKVARTRAAAAAAVEERLRPGAAPPPEPIHEPGRPARPRLVAPGQVARRKLNTVAGRVALVHALAHIEFNAINLAWDAVYRFRGLPLQFYRDWVGVALEEAEHFELLTGRLEELGFAYGDFDAHDGLWEMARKTDHDVVVRLALVPRVLEARGLDVTPGMVERLQRAGDMRTVSILERILRDEVGHVAIGTHWFRHQCRGRALDPDATFNQLVRQFMQGRIKGPFHEQARFEAGFSPRELEELKQCAEASSE